MGDNMKTHSPPRLASWLLRCFAPALDREQIMGDLAEEFSLRARSSQPCSSWYWEQTLSSIPAMAWSAARQGCWIRTFLVGLGAYVVAALLEAVAQVVILGIVRPESSLRSVVSVLIGVSTMVTAGYVAARLRPGAETVMSVIVFLAVTALFVARPGDAPLWYGLTFLIVGPVATLAGGALFLRNKR
jgi:hypothetical protein